MKIGDLVKLRNPIFGATKISGILIAMHGPKKIPYGSVSVLWNDGEIMKVNHLRLEVINEGR